MFARILKHEWRLLATDGSLWLVVGIFAVAIAYGTFTGARWVRFQHAAIAEAAREEFGCTVTRYAGRGAWHQLLISGNGNRWHPAGVGAWLRALGIFGQRSHEKRIPDAAFRLPDAQVALLLRHLWATDGTIAIRRRERRAGVFYSTSSAGLAHDVAALLLRCAPGSH